MATAKKTKTTTTHTKVPVARRALKARINRVLRARGQRLVETIGSNRTMAVGRFYVLDIERNVLVRERIELEAYGRELEVLKPFEALTER